MEFVTIDVETANANISSICQIGIAKYKNGNLVDEWSTLVNPEDYFDPINIDIHGISEDDVDKAPTFPQLESQLVTFLNNSISISHGHFDRIAIQKAIEKYSLNQTETIWLDATRVVRRTWPECARKGYNLSNVCKIIGYQFKHHDALEDAKACGQIMIAAINKTGINVKEWIDRVKKPINFESYTVIKEEGNPEGDFYGEVLVFTGSLTIPRKQAAKLASKAGFTVLPRVTKETTILVVGDQDISRLAGKKKSAKHVKAEKLIEQGQDIRILKESDFIALLQAANINI